MSRYDILCGRTVALITRNKVDQYFYGIDIGIREGTVIAVCHVDADNSTILYDYIDKLFGSPPPLSTWIESLNKDYPLTSGICDRPPEVVWPRIQHIDPTLRDKISFQDINREEHERIERDFLNPTHIFRYIGKPENRHFIDDMDKFGLDKSVYDALFRAFYASVTYMEKRLFKKLTEVFEEAKPWPTFS